MGIETHPMKTLCVACIDLKINMPICFVSIPRWLATRETSNLLTIKYKFGLTS